MKNRESWKVYEGNSPIIATAIHNGHRLFDNATKQMVISSEERLREEDPFTGRWTDITENRIIVDISRFQVDLNRPRENAVYLKPEDSWGLQVWKEDPSIEIVAESLRMYDQFYELLYRQLSKLKDQYKFIVLLDFHTYNHRREGVDGSFAKTEDNPEVNIGTGSMDRQKWAAVVNRFIGDLGSFDYLGRNLDVRENVKFQGGNLSRWVHREFPSSVCAIAIEFKKFFMDEWTGQLDQDSFSAIHQALDSTIPGLIEEISGMDH